MILRVSTYFSEEFMPLKSRGLLLYRTPRITGVYPTTFRACHFRSLRDYLLRAFAGTGQALGAVKQGILALSAS